MSFNFWKPTPEPIIRSEALGILGSDIDLVTDLGIESKWLKDFGVVLRPGRKHRFRIDYLPLNYEAEATLSREFVFNGLRYPVGLPVSTTAKFNTWRFGYEYDFLYTSRGFLGVLFDAKLTDIDVGLNSPIGDEFSQAAGADSDDRRRGPRLRHAGTSPSTARSATSRFPTASSTTTRAATSTTTSPPSSTCTGTAAVQLGYRSIDVFYERRARRRHAELQGLVLRLDHAVLTRRRAARPGHGRVR